MNKQELINKIQKHLDENEECLNNPYSDSDHEFTASVRNAEWNKAMKYAYQLDEPQKVKVPAFVADYIKWCRDRKWQLHTMVMPSNAEYYESHSESSGLHEWINENYATFLIAIATGDYEVEEEPKWVVKVDDNAYFVDFFDSLTPHLVDGLGWEVMRLDDKSKADAVALIIGGKAEKA